jgi:HAD superfamily phosphoserine phosphatase-like hydrolase
MELNKRIVVFDFCETLVDIQTADKFIDYVIEKENYRKYAVINSIIFLLTRSRALALINKFFPKLNLSKRLKLYQIKGISSAIINTLAIRYYNEILVHHKIVPIHELLLSHIANKDHVIIVSGGFAPYISYFSKVYQIQFSVATEIEFHKNKATGKFSGKDCLFDQKVILIEKYLKNNSILYDESVVYTDSIMDLPLLLWADTAYVVSYNKSQNWAVERGFKEIIWKHDL